MIKEQTAYAAIRSLSVDVANLTARIALLQASNETLLTIKQEIHRDQWIGHSNGDEPATVTLPLAEVEKVAELLDALESMQ